MSASHVEYTGETKVNMDGVILRRIRAARDIGELDVSAGELGGWVEDINRNLRDMAWVSEEAELFGQAIARHRSTIAGKARVSGDAQLLDDAKVMDFAVVGGRSKVMGEACVGGRAVIDGNVRVSDLAHVLENTHLSGRTVVGDSAIIRGNSMLTDNSCIQGNTVVAGDAIISGDAYINRGLLAGAVHVKCVSDVLVVEVYQRAIQRITLATTLDGHAVFFNDWSGTINEFKELVRDDKSPQMKNLLTPPSFRPELDAAIALMSARVQRWDNDLRLPLSSWAQESNSSLFLDGPPPVMRIK